MTEKRFLGFMSIEGAILIVLGLCILILPKLTSLTFGVMVSSAFITYGIYKFVASILNRSMPGHFVCEMVMAIYITVIGILLLFVPRISILWLMALIGVYFILDSVLIKAFVARIMNVLNFWWGKLLVSCFMFLAGLIILLGLPNIAFWTVAILTGICFLIKGMSKITLFLANKNRYVGDNYGRNN